MSLKWYKVKIFNLNVCYFSGSNNTFLHGGETYFVVKQKENLKSSLSYCNNSNAVLANYSSSLYEHFLKYIKTKSSLYPKIMMADSKSSCFYQLETFLQYKKTLYCSKTKKNSFICKMVAPMHETSTRKIKLNNQNKKVRTQSDNTLLVSILALAFFLSFIVSKFCI